MTLYDFAEGNPRCLQDAANKRGRVWLYRPDLLLELGELGMLTGRALSMKSSARQLTISVPASAPVPCATLVI